MAFTIVKMGNKNPKTSPSLCTTWALPNLIQQCLDPPHALPKPQLRPVEALLHTYTVKSPLVTMARPKFAPKSTPSREPIPKPQYLPHPWSRPTYDAKRNPDLIHRFSTMHWTDPRTDIPTHRPPDRPRESLITIGRYAPTATWPNNNGELIINHRCAYKKHSL